MNYRPAQSICSFAFLALAPSCLLALSAALTHCGRASKPPLPLSQPHHASPKALIIRLAASSSQAGTGQTCRTAPRWPAAAGGPSNEHTCVCTYILATGHDDNTASRRLPQSKHGICLKTAADSWHLLRATDSAPSAGSWKRGSVAGSVVSSWPPDLFMQSTAWRSSVRLLTI